MYVDNNLSDSEIFDELLELCSWYDPTEDPLDVYDESDEALEMIKRNLNAEVKYSSPKKVTYNTAAALTFTKKSSSFISLSSLRLNSSVTRKLY